MNTKGIQLLAAATLLSAGLAACSSVPVPTAQLQSAEQAVSKINETDIPLNAQLNARDAREKLDAAKAAVAAKENAKARTLAEQAQADAELAIAKANSGKAQAAVDELEKSINSLQSEINRGKGVR